MIPEEDRRRIEKNWTPQFQVPAIDECEYWQSKLKERDELLAEMAEYIKDTYGAYPNGMQLASDLLTKYSNLKAKYTGDGVKPNR